MTVGIQTLRPSGTASFDAASLTVTGAATVHAALADDDDGTYVFGHSFDGAGAGQAIVTFPAPVVAVGERVARVRARLRAQDTDANGTTIRADGGDAQGRTPGYTSSAPTVLAAADYLGPWFAYRPQGGAWATDDAGNLNVLLAFVSGATAAGANAIALALDVDVRPYAQLPHRPDRR